MSNPAIVAAKRQLRSTVKKTLDSLTLQDIAQQSGLTLAHVLSHPSFIKAKTISCYLSMPTAELDTQALVSTILRQGKILFVPRIDRSCDAIDMLRVYDEEDLSSFPSGKWGIREPGLERHGERRLNAMDPECPPLDLILLPGMAFDRTMSRLGHGKGYYDRFLTSYRAALGQRMGTNLQDTTMPALMGLCLTQQLLDTGIPMVEKDWRMDGILYPGGLVMKSS